MPLSKRSQRASQYLTALRSGGSIALNQRPEIEQASPVFTEELEAKSLETDDIVVSDEPDTASLKPSRSPFASLGVSQVENEAEDEDEGLNDVENDDTAEPQQDAPVENTTPKQQKPKKKKKKGKSKALASDSPAIKESLSPSPKQHSVKETKNEELDEIDRAIQELSTKDTKDSRPLNPINSQTRKIQNVFAKFRSLISVDPKHLDPEAELKKLFGASVVRSNQTPSQSSRLPRKYRARTFLSKAPTNLPPISMVKHGMQMRKADPYPTIDTEIAKNDNFFTFTHSKTYISTELSYLEAVQSFDPNSLLAILRMHPYHTDTLLQLSDMSMQQGDQGQAETFLDCALHAYDNAFLPQCQLNNGSARLLFDKIENRGLFRGLERRVHFATKRGTWRTAMEFCKALFCLDPYTDPYGALFHMDFLAIQSEQFSWFLEFFDNIHEFAAIIEQPSLVPEQLPGLYYSRSLAHFRLECQNNKEHFESSHALKEAALRFPMTLYLILTKIGVDIPHTLATEPRAKIAFGFNVRPDYFNHLYSHLYVERSESLWKEPEIIEWIEKTMDEEILPCLNDENDPNVQISMNWFKNGIEDCPFGALRNAAVSEIPIMKSLLGTNVNRWIAESPPWDLIPPRETAGYTTYDEAYFEPVTKDQRRQRDQQGSRQNTVQMQRFANALQGLLGSDDIDADTRTAILEQLQELNGGGGLDLAALAQNAGAGAGGTMPGELDIDIDSDYTEDENEHHDSSDEDGDEEDDDEDDEDDEDNDNEMQQAPQSMFQIVRNLFGASSSSQSQQDTTNNNDSSTANSNSAT